MTYQITKTDNEGVNPSDAKNLDYVFSPFLRYYFSRAFIQAQGNFGKSDFTQNGDLYIFGDYYDMNVENIHNILGWGIGFGYDFNLTDRLFLEPIIKYNSNKHIDKVNDNDRERNGMLLHIGLIFNL